MPILNYTTQISAQKTLAQIQKVLADHGAKSVKVDYEAGAPVALSFLIQAVHGEVAIRLPAKPVALREVMRSDGVPRRYLEYSHVVDVAWRILKDWVEAQLALIETDMVKMEEVFLPYAITQGNKTVYELMVEKRFALAAPGEGGAR